MTSRAVIGMEKYCKQVTIEAETMVAMCRTMILPAVIGHQTHLAEAVAALDAAQVDADDQRAELNVFLGKVAKLKGAIEKLDEASDHGGEDPQEHSVHIKKHVKPLMAELRGIVDDFETVVADELWPLPSYRDMLFVK
jgi:glutamine synthetase